MKTNKQKRELRVRVAPRKIEVRKNPDGSQTIAGQAVVYGGLSQDLGGFVERIAPGAFAFSLRTDDQLCLYGHDDRAILGRKSSGTLTLTDTPSALEFSCVLPNTPDGQTVAELCRRGDLQGMSFGFTVTDDDWDEDQNGNVIRTVNEATLYEISVVGQPAYSQSTVSLRSCPLALRSRLQHRSQKTKTVDGVSLPPSSFAYVGDESDPDTWHLPIHFPGDAAKTESHIKDALARFNQTEGIPDSEKQEVYGRIVGAAKAHGIHVAKESYRDLDDADCDPEFDADCDDDGDDDDRDIEDGVNGDDSFDSGLDDDMGISDLDDRDREDLLRIRQLFNSRRLNSSTK